MSLIPFGKFKGQDIEDIPSPYLRWVICEKWFERKFPPLVKEIDKELKFRDQFNLHFDEFRGMETVVEGPRCPECGETLKFHEECDEKGCCNYGELVFCNHEHA